jgi:hypothetical protein
VPGAAPLRVRERPSRLAGWVARPPVAGPMSVGCTQGVDGDGVTSATSSPPAWRTTRSAGCGWTAPSSEPIASSRHVATDVVAPRVHAGVVHAWPPPYAPATGALARIDCWRWYRTAADRRAERRASFHVRVTGPPWSANLGLLEPPHPAMTPGGGNGRPIGRSVGVVRCATRRPTSSSGESGSSRPNNSPHRGSGSRSAGAPDRSAWSTAT